MGCHWDLPRAMPRDSHEWFVKMPDWNYTGELYVPRTEQPYNYNQDRLYEEKGPMEELDVYKEFVQNLRSTFRTTV